MLARAAMKSWKANRQKIQERRARRRRKLEVVRNRPPAGSSPGDLTISQDASPTSIRATRYAADGIEEVLIRNAGELERFCRPDGVLWVDVQGLGDRDALEWIGRTFALHALLLEDVVHLSQRPKCEAYGESVFLVLRRLVWKGDPCDPVDERQLSLVLGGRHVLSFQERPDDVFEPVRRRLLADAGRMRAAGADYLFYALADAVVDEYLPILDKLGERLDTLEDQVVECPTREILRELAGLRHDLIAFRRDAWPQREALHLLWRGDVGRIGDAVKPYLRDVHDHCVQVAEMVEVYREIASGLLNIYLTSIANRTNEVMKVLTVMATIFIPLTFLVGVWGMNFEHMPELHQRWAYPAVWVLMLAVAGVLFVYFRRRGWIGREPE